MVGDGGNNSRTELERYLGEILAYITTTTKCESE